MTVRLYELCGADTERVFSPYAWRTRMALAHKGITPERIPVRFIEKDKIAFSNQKLVPVLVDGDKVVTDSWAIASHLAEAYPKGPALFGSPVALGTARFVNDWANTNVNAALFPLILMDVFNCLDAANQAYFRESREKRFGMTLEQFAADRDRKLPAFRAALAPARTTLGAQPFLAGDQPAYADYILFGNFMWAKCTSPLQLLEKDDPVYAWRDRLLSRFDGMAAKAKGFPV